MPKPMKATRYKKTLASRAGNVEWLVEPKIDGMRMIAHVSTKNKVSIYSYAGKVMKYWHGVFDEAIVKFVRKGLKITGAYVLDGEVKLKNGNFQDTMSAKAEDAPKGDLVYYIFDHMTLKEWTAQDCVALQINRSRSLRVAFKKLRHACGNVSTLLHSVVDASQIRQVYKTYIAYGHEGAVAKRVDGEYEWKRSKNWFKLKPLHTYDGLVVAIHEGKGKFLGMAGSITVEGTIDDENETRFTTNVNLSTNKVRSFFWKNRKKLLKAWVEIKAQEPSFKAKRGKIAALRHSKYIKLREKGDK